MAEPLLSVSAIMSDVPSTSEAPVVAPAVEAEAAVAPKPQKEKAEQAKKVANTSKRGRNKNKGIIEIEPVMGTRDFYPEDMRLRTWLFEQFREVAKSYCFQEYDCPVLELEELYKRKAGEDITKQMYNFKDKDGYDVALRPEMTPSLARLILKRGKAMLLPVRWFAIPQCWRFETIQLGRKREHFQWNMDVVGVGAVTCEVELLGAITTFFSRVGLTSKDVGIKVNSRKVLQQVLEPLGVVGEKFAPVCVVVDKLDKLTEEEVHKELTALELGPEIIAKISEALSIKDLAQLESMLGPENPAVVELKTLWSLAEAYGFADWLIFDASVVRGLAYYTGVVFEAFDRNKQFRAICGGGRYDGLLSLYGATKEVTPAAGFGMGDVVILELLKAKGLLPVFAPHVDIMIVPYSEEFRPQACQVATKLRALGKKVEVQLIPKKKVAWCYEQADRIGANQLCFVAPDEWAVGKVRIKNLRLPEGAPNKEFDIEVEKLDTL